MRYRIFALYVAFVCVGLQYVCAATTRHVPSDYATISAAQSAAQSGDVIQIESGVYDEAVVTTKSGITYRGVGDSTMISGANNASPFRVKHSNTVIEQMVLFNGGGTTQGSDNAGVVVETGSGVVVRQVTIQDCTYGVITGNALGSTTSPRIERVVIESCSFWGVDARGSSAPVLVNSLIRGCQSGVRAQQQSAPDIINNTIVNCSSRGVLADGTGSALIQNNVVCFCTTGIRVLGSAVVRANNAFGNSTSANAGVTGNYDGFTPNSSNLHADPLFISSGSGNFHLLAESPCKDKAWSSLSPNVDFDGNARPQGGGYDIGFDEISVATSGYTEAALNGSYAEHDLFALLNGGVLARTGTAQFDGVANVLLTPTGGGLQAFGYDVVSDGGYCYLGSGWTGASDFVGTVGLGGDLPLHSSYVGATMDSQISQGYAGYRVPVRLGSAFTNARFVGTYSLHALVALNNGDWRTFFGVAQANGAGTLVTFLSNEVASDNFPGVSQGFTVASNGRVAIAGKPNTAATLGKDGALLVQTLDMAANDDPRFPGGYKGLSFGVRRGTSVSATNFNGTYRVHEIIVRGTKAQMAGLGTIQSAGLGTFTGDIRRNGVSQGFNGSIRVNTSGTFYLNTSPYVEGTLGVGGAVAVLTKHAGYVRANTSDETWMQVWLRTAGGAATPTDTDGDGLSDADEGQLGTSPSNPDSDSDGLPDGVDPQPLTPNNTFVATPTSLHFDVPIGTTPTSKTLNLTNTPNPFFSWSVASNKTWLSVTPTSGLGDGTLSVSVNASTLAVSSTPYTATLTLTAPGMANSPMQIPVTVNVFNPVPALTVTPTTLSFEVLEGGSVSASQPISVLSNLPGERAWYVASSPTWLVVTPNGATTPSPETSIAVDPSKLPAAGSPYEGTLRLATNDFGSTPVDVTVHVNVKRPPHAQGVSFTVGTTANEQTQPTLAQDPTSGLYGVAWAETTVSGSTVLAKVFDAEAAAQCDSLVLSSATGYNSRPFIVRNSGSGGFWAVWETRTSALAAPDIQGRIIKPDGTMAGTAFAVVSGTLQERQPVAAYNSDRDEMAVVYTANTSFGMFDVYLLRFQASSAAFISGTKLTNSSMEEEDPAVAYDAAHGEYLVAWSAKTVPGTEQRIRVVRVDGASGQAKGADFVLQDVSGMQRNVQLALDANRGVWSAIWDTTKASPQSSGVWAAEFPAGTSGPAITKTPLVVSTSEYFTNPTFAFVSVGNHYRTLYTKSNAQPTSIYSQKFSSALEFVGSRSAVAWGTGAVSSPRITYNSASDEYFCAFVQASSGHSQVYALREHGTNTDEDNDGLPNDWEREHDLNPFSADGSDGTTGDPDGDALTNAAELKLGTNPVQADSDDDGLWDGLEDANHDGVVGSSETDPTKGDTDEDGFDDSAERQLGSNARDASKTPSNAGLYRIDYSPSYEGVAGTASVYVAVPDTREVTLNLNSPAATGWNPPSGWQASIQGPSQQTFTKGSHRFQLAVTPVAPMNPQNAMAHFAFRVTDGASLNETMTAVMVCDTRRTLSNATLSAEELAAKFAPSLRMHRDERVFYPTRVELAFRGTLLPGLERTPYTAPLGSGVRTNPQEEAYLQLPGGDTVDGLYAAWNSAREQKASESGTDDGPVAYYTVTRLGSRSQETGGSSDDIVIQYYFYYYFDEWGATTQGGHSEPGVWHMFQVLLKANGEPYAATATRQWLMQRDLGQPGGESIAWSDIEKSASTHPVLYIGRGGHTPYFRPGATRYPSGLEVHDGLGEWLDVTLRPLTRLGETNETPWLRYAGRWGGELPPAPDDVNTSSTGTGSQGPVFVGDSSDPSSPTGVQSAWLDPWAWYTRSPHYSSGTRVTLSGLLPNVLYGKTVVVMDTRGRVFRSVSSATTGQFQLSLTPGTYSLVVADVSALGVETHTASLGTDGFEKETILFPVVADLDLGALVLTGSRLSGANAYAVTDSDGDGIMDAEDADIDDDGILNALDPDVLGDGWDDTFQEQDANGNGIPRYYESTNEKIPSASDTDADGFSDSIDMDLDNDGYFNDEEVAAGSNPYLYFDTPQYRLGDVDGSGRIDILDVQLVINGALHVLNYGIDMDLNRDGRLDVFDVQMVIYRALRVL